MLRACCGTLQCGPMFCRPGQIRKGSGSTRRPNAKSPCGGSPGCHKRAMTIRLRWAADIDTACAAPHVPPVLRGRDIGLRSTRGIHHRRRDPSRLLLSSQVRTAKAPACLRSICCADIPAQSAISGCERLRKARKTSASRASTDANILTGRATPGMADRYDGRWIPIAEDMIEHFGLKPGDRVLDVGCGKGFLVKDLLKVCPGIEAFGLD